MKKIMSKEEFYEKMLEISEKVEASKDIDDYKARTYDQEQAHLDADRLVADLLRSLGYEDGIEIYDEMCNDDVFWYA